MKYKQALLISEGNKLKRLENYHAKNGYIIVSASRGENSEEENNKNKNLLKKELGRTGFSFKEVKGYYKEFNMENPSLEKSFIVYAGNKEKAKELYNFAIRCCKVFGQDSVLIANPNETPQYFSKDGKRVDWSNFTNTLYGEEAKKQIAYTSFKKISHNTEKYKESKKQQKKENAFSFV